MRLGLPRLLFYQNNMNSHSIIQQEDSSLINCSSSEQQDSFDEKRQILSETFHHQVQHCQLQKMQQYQKIHVKTKQQSVFRGRPPQQKPKNPSQFWTLKNMPSPIVHLEKNNQKTVNMAKLQTQEEIGSAKWQIDNQE